MPERKTIQRAKQAKKRGQSASTQAGAFVREEIEHIRDGKHGARSAKQAIAIGLSKARRAGVKLPPPKEGSASTETRRRAKRDLDHAATSRPASRKRAAASLESLQDEPRRAASKTALSRHAKAAARRRTKKQRSASAKKAARTRRRNRGSAAD